MVYTAYGLIEPRDQSTFSIGITLDREERLKQHMRYEEANVGKAQRIREIVAAGHVPVIQALERTTSINEARRRERRRIWELRMKMQHYYKREYREFFRNGKTWAKMREAKRRKAAQLKAQNRQSRTMRRGASQC